MAASEVDALKQEILATNQFMENMKSMPNFQSILDVQARALVQRIVKMGGMAADAAAWCKGPWSESHKTEFGNALSTAVAAGGTKKKGDRRAGQEVRSFERFLSEKDLEVLRSDSSLSMKLDILATRCLKVQLVLPTESSYRAIVGAGQAVGNLATSEAELHSVVVDFKKTLKRKTKNFDKNIPLLSDFPLDPTGLPSHVRDAAYSAEDAPHSGCLQQQAIHDASNSLILRGSDRRIRDRRQSGMLAAADSGMAQSAAANMASMTSMLSMMQMCQRMMQEQSMQGQGLPGLQLFGQRRGSPTTSSVTGQDFQKEAEQGTVVGANRQEEQLALTSGTPTTSKPGPAQAASPASTSQKGTQFQVDLEDDIVQQAAAVSDAIDNKKGKNKKAPKTSETFKAQHTKGNGKGKNDQNTKGKGKGKNGKSQGTTKAGAKAKSKPKAGSKSKGQGSTSGKAKCQLSLKRRVALRPNGCSKCRWKVGCYPSCFR